MNRPEVLRYAQQWAEAWNRRDIEALLEHFEDDVVFSSPKALQAVGVPTVHGKVSLRKYWRAAIEPVKAFRFTLRRVIWDPDTSELSIIYDREVDGQRDRASETLQFNDSARVVRGEVFYGVIPQDHRVATSHGKVSE